MYDSDTIISHFGGMRSSREPPLHGTVDTPPKGGMVSDLAGSGSTHSQPSRPLRQDTSHSRKGGPPVHHSPQRCPQPTRRVVSGILAVRPSTNVKCPEVKGGIAGSRTHPNW